MVTFAAPPEACQALGLTDIVCAKKKRKGEAKIKKPLTLGLRWPVEPVNSWFSNFGQLRRNTDRFSRQPLGQGALAVALILTDTDPTQKRLFELFGLDTYAPKR